MPHAFVEQPDGLIAIWSTIVDSFICVNCTPAEAIEEESSSVNGLQGDILPRELTNIEMTGRAFRWAPTFDEAIATMRELHGDEKTEEMLRFIADKA